jgi:tetratricopeptide (TPR) repeat protein
LRRVEAAFVGRAEELELLRRAFLRAEEQPACVLFTLLGTAGEGKSRLVDELLARLDRARVVRGSCLVYGEGITYYPVVEVLVQLLGSEPERTLAELVPDPVAAAALRGLLGAETQPSSPQEAAWAFRKLLEAVARSEPLVVVLDDVHWGEPALFDLVEHVAGLSRDAPILLLCIARPELLEKRPTWAGGMLNATTVQLEPLPPDEAEQLIAELRGGDAIDGGLRARILEAAVGNPLFVEEMVAMVSENRDGDLSVPPTIHALLAARLDQLPPAERVVLERGAVEGKAFHRGAVVALAPEERDTDGHLTRLVRKDLIRPERASIPGEDAFRFRHLLTRDAAYDALPKSTRAVLHERFAAWLEAHGTDLVESDEIVGYHLEQAHRYKGELGEADLHLGARAAARLGGAGARALAREDIDAAASLLSRAASLYPSGDSRLPEVLFRLGDALVEEASFARAVAAFEEAAGLAAAAGNEPLRLVAELERLSVRARVEISDGVIEAITETAARAIPVFESAGDDAALARAWRALSDLEWVACHWAERTEALERALEHARRAGDSRAVKAIAFHLATALMFGPTAIVEIEERARTLVDETSRSTLLAFAAAGRGDLAEARRLAHDLQTQLFERGQRLRALIALELMARVENFGGNIEAASDFLRQCCDGLHAAGEASYLSTVSGEFALVLCEFGRFADAHERAEDSRRLARADDIASQILWRTAEALVLLDRGAQGEAETLVREAIAMLAETDMIEYRGHASRALARVLDRAGRRKEAAASIEEAIGFFERKGLVVPSERARVDLARILGSP